MYCCSTPTRSEVIIRVEMHHVIEAGSQVSILIRADTFHIFTVMLIFVFADIDALVF